MPISFARMTAHIFELLPKPLITNDQLRLLKYDNVLSGKYKNNNDFEFNCSSRFEEEVNKYSYMWKNEGEYSKKKGQINFMIISIVYTIIGLIFCFVLYLAFRAINTGMEAKKANKDLEKSQNDSLDNEEDLIKKLTELKELHEKKILSDEEFAAAKKKILGE